MLVEVTLCALLLPAGVRCRRLQLRFASALDPGSFLGVGRAYGAPKLPCYIGSRRGCRGAVMAQALEQVSRLTDTELVCRLERLVQADRALSAKLLVHLGELDERKLFLARGYSSTFDYCRSALRMSEAEAYLRIQAARVGRRFPVVVERLGAGAVHLSAIKMLASHLTEDNHVQLLDRVRGRTKREIEVLVAELAPKPDMPARMRKLPDARVRAPQASSTALATAVDQASADAPRPVEHAAMSGQQAARAAARQFVRASKATQGPPMAAAAPSRSFALEPPEARASSTPLSPGRFKLELTLGQEAHDQLEQLQELLRHQNPNGDLASIVERALSELLERTMKRRFAQTRAPARRRSRKP